MTIIMMTGYVHSWISAVAKVADTLLFSRISELTFVLLITSPVFAISVTSVTYFLHLFTGAPYLCRRA